METFFIQVYPTSAVLSLINTNFQLGDFGFIQNVCISFILTAEKISSDGHE
jgi:hypothetical protein